MWFAHGSWPLDQCMPSFSQNFLLHFLSPALFSWLIIAFQSAIIWQRWQEVPLPPLHFLSNSSLGSLCGLHQTCRASHTESASMVHRISSAQVSWVQVTDLYETCGSPLTTSDDVCWGLPYTLFWLALHGFCIFVGNGVISLLFGFLCHELGFRQLIIAVLPWLLFSWSMNATHQSEHS